MQSLTAGGGLQNLGNTCFFNATLQSLLHTPPLARLFQNHLHSQHCHSHQWCVFCQMENIYTKTRQSRCFAPQKMIEKLKTIFKKFKLGRQEDSHEFLRYLVEGMQESETGKLGKDREQNQKKIKKTKVFNYFGGVIKTCVQCLSCSHKSITDERYYDFNISQECQRANSLIEGVSSFFTVDKLEGANKYLCEHCKVRSNARKRFILETIPEVATFQLKRFTNNMRKIGKFIQYPLEIDLGKYLEHPRKVTLKLFAIIVHAGGSSFSGHYYAFVRVGNTWYKMDDSYVTKCSFQSAMNQQAYILLYEKQEKIEENGQVKQIKELNGVKKKENGQIKEINGVKKENKKVQALVADKQEAKISEKMVIQQSSTLNLNKQERKAQSPEKTTLKNGIHGKNTPNGIKQPQKIIENNKQVKDKQPQQQVSNKDLAQIEQILIQKLTSAVLFNGLNEQSSITSETIEKAVKQAIFEVTPKKGQEQKKQEAQNENKEEFIMLPSLQRRKSKEQIEREIPYSELVFRTAEKVLELQSKMPPQKPRNFSQRSMYNLRKYETTMQKKRKIG